MDSGYGRSLVKSQRSGDVAHVVDRRFACLRNAAACIGRERFKVAARAFGVQHAKRQRAFARSRNARDCHQLTQGNVDVHVFQVVYACAAHFDVIDVVNGVL